METYIGIQDLCVSQGVVLEDGRVAVDLLQSQVDCRDGSSSHIIPSLRGDVGEVEWGLAVIVLTMHLLQRWN